MLQDNVNDTRCGIFATPHFYEGGNQVNKTKSVIWIMLCMVFIGGISVPAATAAYAEEAQVTGTCGENLTWVLKSDGTLTISGTGEMTNYTYYVHAPWADYGTYIKFAVVENGITTIGDYAFNDVWLEEIVIPDSVTAIGRNAFTRTKLSSITISENIKNIGHACFWNCNDLSKVVIESEETEFENQVFEGCPLENAGPIGSGCDIEFGWITKIPNYVFYGCQLLSEIEIPDSVTTIGSSAFCDCIALITIELPEGIASIGNQAFRACKGLEEIRIPDTVVSLGNYAFYECNNLKTITLSNRIKTICYHTFNGCSSLEKIVIPDSVEVIEGRAFLDCVSLREITIPNSVISMKPEIFQGCSALQNIYIDNVEGVLTDAPWAAPNAALTYLRKIVIQPIAESYCYTGREIEPEIFVSEDKVDGTFSKPLIEGTEYTVSYFSNVYLGTARIDIHYHQNYANLGTWVNKLAFNILPKPASEVTIAPISAQAYTGKAITPNPTITN